MRELLAQPERFLATVLVGTNLECLRACLEAAKKAGHNTLLLSSRVQGETRDVARMHAAISVCPSSWNVSTNCSGVPRTSRHIWRCTDSGRAQS